MHDEQHPPSPRDYREHRLWGVHDRQPQALQGLVLCILLHWGLPRRGQAVHALEEFAEALRRLQALQQARRHMAISVACDDPSLLGNEQGNLFHCRIGPRKVCVTEADEGWDVQRGLGPCPSQWAVRPWQVTCEDDKEVEHLRKRCIALGSTPCCLHHNTGTHVKTRQAIKGAILLQELSKLLHGFLKPYPVLQLVVDTASLHRRIKVPVHPVVRPEGQHQLPHVGRAVPLPGDGVRPAEVVDLEVVPPGHAVEGTSLLEDVVHLRHAAPVVGAASVQEGQLELPRVSQPVTVGHLHVQRLCSGRRKELCTPCLGGWPLASFAIVEIVKVHRARRGRGVVGPGLFRYRL
mmetsp:Transcript_70753/g.207241  ORF Transcript_70753/g.207241 Transcript_70753/m.207241 type:complete len:349 (-) Transcript_70753:29-1075(-)